MNQNEQTFQLAKNSSMQNNLFCYINLVRKFICIILCFSFYSAYSHTTTIKKGDNNTRAKQELARVFKEGGQITFEEGTWTINLSTQEARILNDVIIIGANIKGTGNIQGAYETPASNLKSTVIFTGSRFSIQKSCKHIKVQNISLNGRGFIAVNQHQIELDLENSIFDITTAPRGFLDKQIFRSPDGIQGKVTNCSFKGFERGFVSNRSVNKNAVPFTIRKKIEINWCSFIPEPYYQTRLPEAFIIDAGNDEYPVLWNQSSSTISNSYIKNCRIACSKGENFNIIDNTFFIDQFPKEPIHLEEFSQHILVKNNTLVFRGSKGNRQIITLGATQSCNDITIEGNTVDQLPGTNLINNFVTGMALNNITLKNNTILNHVASRDYVSFWGCGHTNITIEPGQQGFSPSQVSIATKTCDIPFDANGVYTIKWKNSAYLGNVANEVKVVSRTQEPSNDDNFLWEIVSLDEDGTTLGNYYTIRNKTNGKYLQVYKGPNAPQQKAQIGQRYTNGSSGNADATFKFDFEGISSRPPGWSLFKGGNGDFLMSPAMNEHKAQLKKLHGSEVATLFVIKNRESGSYDWSFNKTLKQNLSTNDVFFKNKIINIYPNPSINKVVTIELPEDNDRIDLRIFDQSGKQLYQNKFSKTATCDMSSFSSGIYYFHLNMNNKVIVEKIILN